MLQIVVFLCLKVGFGLLPEASQSRVQVDERVDHLKAVLHLRELSRKQRLLCGKDLQIGGRSVVHQFGGGGVSLLQGYNTLVDMYGHLFRCRAGVLVLIHLPASIVKRIDKQLFRLFLVGLGVLELRDKLSALENRLRQRTHQLSNQAKCTEAATVAKQSFDAD